MPACDVAVDPRMSRGGIFLLRRQAARKVIPKEKEVSTQPQVKHSRRSDQLPQVNCNGSGRSTPKPAKTELSGYRLPMQLRTFPKDEKIVQNCSIDKGARSARIFPVHLAPITDAAPTVVVVPQLVALRQATPDTPEIVQLVPTPPPSDRELFLIVESAVQTDDNFDAETAQLVEHLVSAAIARASVTLEKEQEIEQLRLEAAKNQQLQEELQMSRMLAMQTCNEVMLSSMAHLNDPPKIRVNMRSIGLDTSSLTKRLKSLDLLKVELEHDFFPWIFAKADRMFRRKMSAIQLEDGTEEKFQKNASSNELSQILVMIRRSVIRRSAKFAKV
ncbi:hypothetical protein Y032_0001g236 [Ancylostoma ceylanicum]|uniref:Uncharacterized protein n=2 Tax=Ancylostoma ceylanicum TaxID=53326 RepID=A0A016W492_9BILA|nr:hypothetical protein Y032_0001g236 [Ancylostoma ceylanicum]